MFFGFEIDICSTVLQNTLSVQLCNNTCLVYNIGFVSILTIGGEYFNAKNPIKKSIEVDFLLQKWC